MKLRDATVSKGMTVNLGQYNSHRVEIGLSATFDDDDDFEAGMTKLTALVNSYLIDEIKQVTSDSKKPKQILTETKLESLEG